MQIKRKQGESEAIKILKSIGIQIAEDYCDDNSSKSMPDLKYANGRGIEVTHTYHNNAIHTKLNQYLRKQLKGDPHYWIEKNLEIEERCSEAIDRVHSLGYDMTAEGELSDDAIKLYKEDCKILKSHIGYDPTK